MHKLKICPYIQARGIKSLHVNSIHVNTHIHNHVYTVSAYSTTVLNQLEVNEKVQKGANLNHQIFCSWRASLGPLFSSTSDTLKIVPGLPWLPIRIEYPFLKLCSFYKTLPIPSCHLLFIYSFIPQIFTEICRVQGTSHILVLSDRDSRNLPSRDDKVGVIIQNGNVNINTRWVITGYQVLQPVCALTFV